MRESAASVAENGRSALTFEVVVVGAGQAGLAIGYFLARQGRRFVILDRADTIASAWRERWESLTLFTPRRYNSLPGLPFPGDPEGYPTRDEVIAYLERYAETFELPVELNSNVRRLSADDCRLGVTDVPGVYFLGLTWQHTRGSALIGWVKDDAEFIARSAARKEEPGAGAPAPARTKERV
jgi:glycine/D-amino acid oxidase-like deaminating enzyme